VRFSSEARSSHVSVRVDGHARTPWKARQPP